MNNPTNMSESDFTEYLAKHHIFETVSKTRDGETEIEFPCPFNGCDDDRRQHGEELHCSFNLNRCVYHCFKCGKSGNFIELLKFFGDYEEYSAEQKPERVSPDGLNSRKLSFETRVLSAHKNTREQARDYFNGRGINNESIDRHLLGCWTLNGHKKYMIPIFDRDGKIAYIKLRKTEEDERSEMVGEMVGNTNTVPKYIVYPTGAKLLLVGENELVKSTSSDVLICEGELDRIIAIQEGVKIPIVTGGGGAQTFKDEWIDSLKNMRNIYICMDRDEAGTKGASALAARLAERIPTASVYMVSLPLGEGTHGDLTDYFVQGCGTADELFSKYSEFYCGAKPIDASQFKEMTVRDIADVLDSTIKYDFTSKVITLLSMVLTYTESDQQNIMFNADSSAGKTYICQEVSKYFPPQDVRIYGKTTPTAFYYSPSLQEIDATTGQPFINLERRILVFTEQPDTQLQENLRALLSHDGKRIPFAITNKSRNGKNIAMEGYILGFPSTFFCSANMRIDEQEQTRCLILSPDNSSEKIMAGIDVSIAKNSNRESYDRGLESNESRRQLMERILYIKNLGVDTIDIGDSEYLKKRFMDGRQSVLLKTQREISHFMSLVKAMALINAPFRMVNGKIVANHKDVDEVAELWSSLSRSMAYGISPQAFNFYEQIILPAFITKNTDSSQEQGITYDEIRKAYYNRNGHFPNMENIRKQYIPALKTAALISCDKDENDKRQNIITPLVFFDD